MLKYNEFVRSLNQLNSLRDVHHNYKLYSAAQRFYAVHQNGCGVKNKKGKEKRVMITFISSSLTENKYYSHFHFRKCNLKYLATFPHLYN